MTMRWRFWRRWTVITTLGELLGFAAPAVVGALLAPEVAEAASRSVSVWFALAMMAAGGVEGAVLGAAQALVLRSGLPELPLGSWIGRTALGAAAAWAMGMTPSTMVDVGFGARAAMAAGIALTPALLVSIGVMQWTVLRKRLPKAGWWIPATAGAWLCGLAVVFAAMALVDERTPRGSVIAVSVLGGLGMGAVAAAISGLAMARLLAGQPPAA